MCLADVHPEPVNWLWPGRLARGKLTMLDGDPAVGKSTLAAEIAATVTTGRDWPDGAPCAAGAVLLMSAEDGLGDTICPRVAAAGGHIDRVHALVAVEDDLRGGRQQRPATLGDLGPIETMIKNTEAALLVVDVLMAYLPAGVDSHRDQDVRRVLAPLSAVAERTNCAVLLIRHLTKASGGRALYRGGGSIGIVGAARTALLAAADPAEPGCGVLAGLKSNLGPLPAALRYRIVAAPEHDCGRVQWLGTSALTADDLVADAEPRNDEGLAHTLRTIVEDAGGEISVADGLNKLAELCDSAPSRATIDRARKRAGILTRKSNFHGGWTWYLPPGNAAAGVARSWAGPASEPTSQPDRNRIEQRARHESLKPGTYDRETFGTSDQRPRSRARAEDLEDLGTPEVETFETFVHGGEIFDDGWGPDAGFDEVDEVANEMFDDSWPQEDEFEDFDAAYTETSNDSHGDPEPGCTEHPHGMLDPIGRCLLCLRDLAMVAAGYDSGCPECVRRWGMGPVLPPCATHMAADQ